MMANKLGAIYKILVIAGAAMFAASVVLILVALTPMGMAMEDQNTVRLEAPYGSTIVQMFSHTYGDITSDDVTRLPDGMRCQVLQDARPYDVGDGGPPIIYYKLDCDGDVGYVSEMWAR